MLAKVTKVDQGATLNSNGKTYKGIKLYVIPDGKDEQKDYFIFGNADFAQVVKNLNSGDYVDLEFTRNGKYMNLTGVKKAEAPTHAQAETSYKSAKTSAKSEEEKAAITRTSALYNAVEIAKSLLETGGIKKTIKKEAYIQEVFDIARSVESFLKFQDSPVATEQPTDNPFSSSDEVPY